MSEYCIHDFAPGQCGYCKSLPFGLNNVGFRTKFGKVFHNWSNCEFLADGQKFAESQGGVASDINNVTWSSAIETLTPCEWCCALYYSKGENLEECLIETSGGSLPAKIVKDRYLGKNVKEFQIYFPDTGEIEVMLSRYVKRFK